RNCLCNALNPTCPPCDDPAVLLACLEVEDCTVVRICNLERSFVVSPAALRYWLPLSQIGRVFEAVCCPTDDCAKPVQPSVNPNLDSIRPFGTVSHSQRPPQIMGVLVQLACGGEGRQSFEIGALLLELLIRSAVSERLACQFAPFAALMNTKTAPAMKGP